MKFEIKLFYSRLANVLSCSRIRVKLSSTRPSVSLDNSILTDFSLSSSVFVGSLIYMKQTNNIKHEIN